MSEADGELLQFLFAADKFRFNSTQLRPKELFHEMEKLKCDYHPYVQAVKELHANRIEMPAAFCSLCNYLWDLFLTKAQRVHQSSVWPSFSKKIVEGFQVDLPFIITDDHYFGYFKQYLLQSPGDAESLACWRDIRHVLIAIQILKKPNSEQPNSAVPAGRRPSVVTTTPPSNITNLTNYPQPYEPLSILLECLRKYYTIIIRGVCGGISQATKIRLSDIHQQTSSIRNLKSLDLCYAADCCEVIETTLTIIVGESYQYLQEKYYLYLKSNEYVATIASIRLKQSENVQVYLRKNVFLQEVRIFFPL
jgi:hypothetical protein